MGDILSLSLPEADLQAGAYGGEGSNKVNWQNKRVLITGAEGFMGSHLTERLVELGAKVTAFVRGTSHCGTTEYQLKNIDPIKGNLEELIAGDIACSDIISLIKKQKPEVIYHLAAIAYVPYSFDHPREVFRVNVEGTLNVLDACMEIPNLERVVITSSSEVYGPAVRDSIDEDHPLNPTSPYAASKAAADRYAHAYSTTYHLPVAIIRPFNYYGPRHLYDVIPKFIKQVLSGNPPTVYGNGSQSRDFVYVDDMVEAFLIMGSHPESIGNTVNFGTNEHTTIKALAEKIIELCGAKEMKPLFVEKRMAEVARLQCNFEKARKLFDWTPKISLEEGLRRNIGWIRENWFAEMPTSHL